MAAGLGLVSLAVWKVPEAGSTILNFMLALAVVAMGMLYFRMLGRLTRCCQVAVAEDQEETAQEGETDTTDSETDTPAGETDSLDAR
jgi:hypothetical protein